MSEAISGDRPLPHIAALHAGYIPPPDGRRFSVALAQRRRQGAGLGSTRMTRFRAAAAFALVLVAFPAWAQNYPAPKEGQWIARDFKFHTGDVFSELRLAYTTVGEPTGQPVLLLHGTTGSARSMLTPAFAGELFGPGQTLDATKYFIIIPDAVGHGKSSKPSDGLKAKFPRYNYDDMVEAQHRLVDQRLAAPCSADANDNLYAWDSSRDYNASPGLERVEAALLAINAADDERNPPETGIMERELKRVKNGRLYLIPASEDTRGHGTTGMAKFFARELQEFLQKVPQRAM